MQNLRTVINAKTYSHFGTFSNKCTKGKKLPLKSDTITYLFAFNGKEKDDESYGVGNGYDYGFRTYSANLGRFLSVDPVGDLFGFWSPYQYAGNDPVYCMDFDGLQRVIRKFHYEFNGKKKTVLFLSSIEKPQSYFMLSFLGVTHHSFKGEKGNSMQLFKPVYCEELAEEGEGGFNKHDNKVMYNTHRGIEVAKLLLAMLDENPDIELVIFGNHDIAIGAKYYNKKGNNELGKVANKQSKEMEDFSLRRALHIRNVFFDKGGQNVVAVAANKSGKYEYRNIKLMELGKEARGITIFFNFNNAPETKSNSSRSTPRFL